MNTTASPIADGGWRTRCLLVCAILLYACAFQGNRPIYSPDEGRYVDVALGMLDDGDWLRPMLHPEFQHWSKPPLTYWVIAGSVGVFGRNEFAARLPNALAFAGTILLLGWAGRRFLPEQSWLAALIYATFALPPLVANVVTTDTLLTLWETLQLTAFAALWWSGNPDEERRARLLMWLGVGLAFLTKGPPGLLMFAGCAVFAAWDAGLTGLSRLLRWDGIAVFLVVGCGWYADAVIHDPGVLRYFLVEEVFNRIATDKMHRNAQWYGAFRVYAPTLALGMLPWLPAILARLWNTRDRRSAPWSTAQSRLLLCCIVLPLMIFLLSRSRLPFYLLPLFAPLALVAARLLAPMPLHSWRARSLLAVWCIALVGARLVPAHLDIRNDDKTLADALLRQLPRAPYEIAFVETTPRFGLRFYLNSAIERLSLPGREPLPSAEPIDEEMSHAEGCRVLLTESADVPDLQAALQRDKVRYRRLADVRGYAVMREQAENCSMGTMLQAH